MNVISPDISVLEFSVLFDISGVPPVITITNGSAGPDLASCSWWYEIITPGGTYIHQGSEAMPDETGVWATITVPDTWPQPFGQIEWGAYKVILYVKDGVGNIFNLTHSNTICRPEGNTAQTIGNFGKSSANAVVRCNDAKLYANDTTNYLYQGIQGTQNSYQWILNAPPGMNGVAPAPVTVNNQSSVLFDIPVNGPGYFLILNTSRTYVLGDNISVKIQYKYRYSFSVACNVDLCPLICDIDQLIQSTKGNCGQTQDPDALAKLASITALLTKALIAKQQPLCGYDVAAIVEEIKEIGGFTCNCIITGDGVNPQAGSDADVILAFTTCGDLQASVASQTGNNITLDIKDYRYILAMSTEATAAGFSWGFNQNAGSCTRTYTLQYSGGGTGGGGCPTNILPLFVHDTASDPVPGCPTPTWPMTVYDISDTTPIGVANDITELVGILNADIGTDGWYATYGYAVAVDPCHVSFPCYSDPVPMTDGVYVEQAGGGTPVPCVGQVKTFETPLFDYDIAGQALGVLIFPGSFFVQYTTSGPVYSLGNIINYNALITALNAQPNKPGSVTFAASAGSNPTTVKKLIFDADCDQIDTVSIFEEVSAPIVAGGNVNYLVTGGLNRGIEGIDALRNDELGRVCGGLFAKDIITWNVVRFQNYIYTVGTNFGNVYKIDMTDPVNPVLINTVPLIGGTADAFSGSPTFSGGVPSHWDVYLLTGYSDDPQYTFILESTSGNIWKYDMVNDAVVSVFQSNQLIGLCPRIYKNGILYFSWDGDRINQTAQTGLNPQYAANNLVFLKVALGFNNANIGGINVSSSLFWALSYDIANNKVWGTNQVGDLFTFDVGPALSGLALANSYINAWNVSGGWTALLNTTLYNGILYASSYGKGTKYIDTTLIITPASSVAFEAMSPATDNHFTFTPVPGKPYGILCVQRGAACVAKYTLTGKLITTIQIQGGNVYNVVPFNNNKATTPNGYC